MSAADASARSSSGRRPAAPPPGGGPETPWAAIARAGLALSVPLAVGAAVGQTTYGALVAMGALSGVISDTADAYRMRLLNIAVPQLFGAAGVALGVLVFGHGWVAVGVVTLLALISGMVSSIGAVASVSGLLLILNATVGAGLPMPGPWWKAPLLLSLGGLLVLLLSLLAWPLRGGVPEAAAVAGTYREAAKLLAAAGTADYVTRRQAVSQSLDVSYDLLLARRTREHGRRGPLVQQLAQLNALIPLIEAAPAAHFQGGPLPPEVPAAVRKLADAIERGGRGARGARDDHGEGQVTGPDADDATGLDADDADGLTDGHATGLTDGHATGLDDSPAAGAGGNATGAFGTAAGVGGHATGVGGDATGVFDPTTKPGDHTTDVFGCPPPTTPAARAVDRALRHAARIARDGDPDPYNVDDHLGRPAALRIRVRRAARNIALSGTSWRYGLRLALCIGLAQCLVSLVDVPRSYWVTLTVVFVLKPDFGSVFSRAVLRAVGTAAGLVLAAVVLAAVPRGWWDVPVMLVLGGLIPLLTVRGYAYQTAAVTPVILLLSDLLSHQGFGLIGPRLLDSLIGCAISLVAGYLLWPESWGTRVGDRLVTAVADTADYVALAFAEPPDPAARAHSRRHLYRDLMAVRTEFQRALTEPPPMGRRAAAWWPLVIAVERIVDATTAARVRVDHGAQAPPPAEIAAVRAQLVELATGLRDTRTLTAVPADLPGDEEGVLAPLRQEVVAARTIASPGG